MVNVDSGRRVINALFLISAVAVIIGSLLPGASPVIRAISMLPVSDKMLHFGAYLLLSTLAALGQRGWRTAILFALSLAVLGGALELAQHLVPGRTPELADEAANVFGVLCGLVIGRTAAPK